ncbi:MAG: hypothetical protein ACRYFA_05945 [Janthinobacterium lividum]
MKKAILKTILAGALVLSIHVGTQAQVSVNINVGSQPAWGPSGYNHVDYYYLPDIESYYDVSTGQYIYQDGGRWIFANNLPSRYRGYDLYSGYKVVVNRPKPYLNFNRDRTNYGRYKNWSGTRQPMLRESRNMGGNRPGNNGNMNHGNNGMNHGGLNRGNMNQGNNGMNRGNINQGGQPNQMNNGQRGNQQTQGQNRSQGQNRPQGQGGQQNGDGGRGQRP